MIYILYDIIKNCSHDISYFSTMIFVIFILFLFIFIWQISFHFILFRLTVFTIFLSSSFIFVVSPISFMFHFIFIYSSIFISIFFPLLLFYFLFFNLYSITFFHLYLFFFCLLRKLLCRQGLCKKIFRSWTLYLKMLRAKARAVNGEFLRWEKKNSLIGKIGTWKVPIRTFQVPIVPINCLENRKSSCVIPVF